MKLKPNAPVTEHKSRRNMGDDLELAASFEHGICLVIFLALLAWAFGSLS